MLNIKKARKEKSMSLDYLANATGITYKALWNIEKGGDAKVSTLYKIAEALEVSIKDLFD